MGSSRLSMDATALAALAAIYPATDFGAITAPKPPAFTNIEDFTNRIVHPQFLSTCLYPLLKISDHVHDFGNGLRSSKDERIKTLLREYLTKIYTLIRTPCPAGLDSDTIYNSIEDRTRDLYEKYGFLLKTDSASTKENSDIIIKMTMEEIKTRALYLRTINETQVELLGSRNYSAEENAKLCLFITIFLHGETGDDTINYTFDATPNKVSNILMQSNNIKLPDIIKSKRIITPQNFSDSANTSLIEYCGDNNNIFAFSYDRHYNIRTIINPTQLNYTSHIGGPISLTNNLYTLAPLYDDIPNIAIKDFTIWEDSFVTVRYIDTGYSETNHYNWKYIIYFKNVQGVAATFVHNANNYIGNNINNGAGTMEFVPLLLDLSYSDTITQSPSVDQLSKLYAYIVTEGTAYPISYIHSKKSMINLFEQFTSNHVIHIKFLLNTYGYNIFMLIKILGDWGQIFGMLLLRASDKNYNFSTFVSIDPTACILSRLLGLSTWQHWQHRHRLYRCIDTEKALPPVEIALLNINRVLQSIDQFIIFGTYIIKDEEAYKHIKSNLKNADAAYTLLFNTSSLANIGEYSSVHRQKLQDMVYVLGISTEILTKMNTDFTVKFKEYVNIATEQFLPIFEIITTVAGESITLTSSDAANGHATYTAYREACHSIIHLNLVNIPSISDIIKTIKSNAGYYVAIKDFVYKLLNTCIVQINAEIAQATADNKKAIMQELNVRNWINIFIETNPILKIFFTYYTSKKDILKDAIAPPELQYIYIIESIILTILECIKDVVNEIIISAVKDVMQTTNAFGVANIDENKTAINVTNVYEILKNTITYYTEGIHIVDIKDGIAMFSYNYDDIAAIDISYTNMDVIRTNNLISEINAHNALLNIVFSQCIFNKKVNYDNSVVKIHSSMASNNNTMRKDRYMLTVLYSKLIQDNKSLMSNQQPKYTLFKTFCNRKSHVRHAITTARGGIPDYMYIFHQLVYHMLKNSDIVAIFNTLLTREKLGIRSKLLYDVIAPSLYGKTHEAFTALQKKIGDSKRDIHSATDVAYFELFNGGYDSQGGVNRKESLHHMLFKTYICAVLPLAFDLLESICVNSMQMDGEYNILSTQYAPIVTIYDSSTIKKNAKAMQIQEYIVTVLDTFIDSIQDIILCDIVLHRELIMYKTELLSHKFKITPEIAQQIIAMVVPGYTIPNDNEYFILSSFKKTDYDLIIDRLLKPFVELPRTADQYSTPESTSESLYSDVSCEIYELLFNFNAKVNKQYYTNTQFKESYDKITNLLHKPLNANNHNGGSYAKKINRSYIKQSGGTYTYELENPASAIDLDRSAIFMSTKIAEHNSIIITFLKFIVNKMEYAHHQAVQMMGKYPHHQATQMSIHDMFIESMINNDIYNKIYDEYLSINDKLYNDLSQLTELYLNNNGTSYKVFEYTRQKGEMYIISKNDQGNFGYLFLGYYIFINNELLELLNPLTYENNDGESTIHKFINYLGFIELLCNFVKTYIEMTKTYPRFDITSPHYPQTVELYYAPFSDLYLNVFNEMYAVRYKDPNYTNNANYGKMRETRREQQEQLLSTLRGLDTVTFMNNLLNGSLSDFNQKLVILNPTNKLAELLHSHSNGEIKNLIKLLEQIPDKNKKVILASYITNYIDEFCSKDTECTTEFNVYYNSILSQYNITRLDGGTRSKKLPGKKHKTRKHKKLIHSNPKPKCNLKRTKKSGSKQNATLHTTKTRSASRRLRRVLRATHATRKTAS